MSNTVKENFRTAMRYYLERDGRGAQSKLARKTNINPGYLSAIIKGTQPGSDEAKENICRYYGISYEYMLALGRWIKEGKDPESIRFTPEIDWLIIRKQFSDSSEEDKEEFRNRENITSFKAALREYAKEHPEIINIEKLIETFNISTEDAESLLEEFPAYPNIDIKTADKIAQHIHKTLYDMITIGRHILFGSPWAPSTMLCDVSKEDNDLQKVINSYAPQIGDDKAKVLAYDLFQIAADKKFLPEEYLDELFNKFGRTLMPKELENIEIDRKLCKTDKKYLDGIQIFKKIQSAYVNLKGILNDPKFAEFKEGNEDEYKNIEKFVNSTIPSMGSLVKESLVKKSSSLPEEIANEINDKFKPWSDERARFIWEKGCEQAGLPGLFDSDAELKINAYKKQMYDDGQLYKLATIWAKQKKQVILNVEKNN